MAQRPEFKKYQKGIIDNARVLAESLQEKGYRIVSGGTDNHLLLVDLTNKGITGKDAAASLDKAGITVNKNLIPFDTKSAALTSGIRLGTPAVTTRDMQTAQMRTIAVLIDKVLKKINDQNIISSVKKEVLSFTKRYPLYKGMKR